MTSTPVAQSLLFWGLAMAARIQAGECFIIVVNSNSFTARHKGPERMNWLLLVAEKLQIPVCFVNLNSYSESEIRTQLPKIPKQGEKLIRSKLLISGSDLEQGVSLVTLEALAIGFEVFLVADLIPASDERVAKFCWDRLVQAGAVPTTVTQVSLEIISSDRTEVIQSEIKELLSVFREMQS
jgi:hypothetical protein